MTTKTSLPRSRQEHNTREVEPFTAYLAMIDFIDNEMPNLGSLAELRTALVIWRQTHGWGKLTDSIGITQFVKKTASDPKAISRALSGWRQGGKTGAPLAEQIGVVRRQTRETAGDLARTQYTWPINRRVREKLKQVPEKKAVNGGGGVQLPPTPDNWAGDSPENGGGWGTITPHGGVQLPPTQTITLQAVTSRADATASVAGFSSEEIYKEESSSSGFFIQAAREETEAKHDDDEIPFSENENPTPEPAARVELPADEDENLPAETETSKTPDLVATVPTVTSPEDRGAALDYARDALWASVASSRAKSEGITQTAALKTTKAPDKSITSDILAAFQCPEDFETWIADTESRNLANKAREPHAPYALYRQDAKIRAEDIADDRVKAERLAVEEQAAEVQRAEEQRARAEFMATAMDPVAAIAAVDGGARKVADALQKRFKRLGTPVSPNDVMRAAREYWKCPSCRDGLVGTALERTLTFCDCMAGEELKHEDAQRPGREIEHAHSSVKNKLVAAAQTISMHLADAIEGSTITETPSELVFDVPKGYRLYFIDPGFRKVLKIAGEQRPVRLAWEAAPKPPEGFERWFLEPETAVATGRPPITQADVERELAKRQQRKPPAMEPIGDWIGGAVQ